MALRKSCVTRNLTTKETAHCYELRWTVKNAKSRLLSRDALLSGTQEVNDPVNDRYELKGIAMELRPDPAQDGQLKLLVTIAQFRKNVATHVMLSSYIEKVALHEFNSDTTYVVGGALTAFCFNSFSRHDLLDESQGLIVNDALTIVLERVINVGGGWTVRLADDAEQPKETAFAKAFDSEFLSDVVLSSSSSDGRKFRAHKIVLAVHSPVFRAMFDSGLKESTESQVEIADCSEEVVEQMLAFMYSGTTPEVGDENLFGLLKAADKYDIKELLAVCEHKIAQTTDSDNAAEVLMLADTLGAKMLKKSAVDWIAGHISDVRRSPGWKTLSETQSDLVDEIMQKVADRLNVELL